jgi:hypothetical protein
VSSGADPFNGHIDRFRIVQRSNGCISTTWNKMTR